MSLPAFVREDIIVAIRKCVDSLETAELILASIEHAGYEPVPIDVADAAQKALIAAPRRFVQREPFSNSKWNRWREERS